MRQLLFAILLLAFSAAAARAEERPFVCVFQLTDEGGIGEQLTASLMTKLSAAVTETDLFSLIDQDSATALLEPQGITFASCLGAECALRAGRILSAQSAGTAEAAQTVPTAGAALIR